MTHDPALLDYLESLQRARFDGTVFRYTAGARPPDRENTLGARWNPPGVPAIYVTLQRETAYAELRHHLGMLSPPPSKRNFTLFTIRIGVDMVGDLRSPERIRAVGLTSEILGQPDFAPCQAVGSAARWLKMGGLLVPSARRKDAHNLVIFPDVDDFEFEVLGSEPMTV